MYRRAVGAIWHIAANSPEKDPIQQNGHTEQSIMANY
jgi:hypothetical protein